jgi:hypothetical protein
VCGGEIRASDRAVLAERREAMQAEAQAVVAETGSRRARRGRASFRRPPPRPAA